MVLPVAILFCDKVDRSSAESAIPNEYLDRGELLLPMKILVLTSGSRGDVQPFAALARSLDEAGHQVALGAPAAGEFLVESDVRYIPFDDQAKRLARDPIVQEWLGVKSRGLRRKTVAVQAIRKFQSVRDSLLADLAAAAEYDADIVVHRAGVPGHVIAEKLGVPSVFACLQPYWIPTSSFPSPRIQFPIPRVLNRVSYLSNKLLLRTRQNNGKWRTGTLGLPRRHGSGNALRSPDGNPVTVLQAFSQYALPSPLDYPNEVHTTGFWFLPRTLEWAPPRRLSEFLAAGEPPIYIGFGSMVSTDPHQIGNVVAEAVRLAGVRAVVVAGWGGIQLDESRNDVLCLDYAPFDWLFPRMAALVHHGGCGTTGMALASGRPQVVCPYVLPEQRFYARRMHAIGVAPPPQPHHRWTSHSLGEAIHRAVTSRSLAERAEELGARIRAEDGVTTAVKVLESLT